MAAAASRDLIIKKNSIRWLGITSKGVSISKEAIDITSDEDDGFRTLLAEVGSKTLDISFSGVTKDTVIRTLINTNGSQLYTDITVEFPPVGAQSSGDTISGSFFLNSLSETGGDSNGTISFDGALQSSGAWTYTAGA
jgi:predicted secreted protein|tara:strand:- start:149 stop:562 length:414 start_codon:yes stop_codon:yes gene_type:complete